MAGEARNEPHERIAGDDAHNHILPCSHNGHNENNMGTQRNKFRLVAYCLPTNPQLQTLLLAEAPDNNPRQQSTLTLNSYRCNLLTPPEVCSEEVCGVTALAGKDRE
jgi:hypothetical protein